MASQQLTTESTLPCWLFMPVEGALRNAQKNFGHTLNLTRRENRDVENRGSDKLCQPTDVENRQLAAGLKKFSAYLHSTASSMLEEAMILQQKTSEKMISAFDLYYHLRRDSEQKELAPTSNPWCNTEWKPLRMRYLLCYMKTRQCDLKRGSSIPQRRGRQEWEDTFLAGDKTQALATEASWSAAAYDAEQEALEACAMFSDAARLLREAAREETIDRHCRLKQASDMWCELYDHHAKVRSQFKFCWGAQDARDAEPCMEDGIDYFALISKTIPETLQKLDTALRVWSREEMAPRGKKVVSPAAFFDDKLQQIQDALERLNVDILTVEAFVQRHVVAVHAYPAPTQLATTTASA